MADNYLENHYEEYLQRKAVWEKAKKHALPKQKPFEKGGKKKQL